MSSATITKRVEWSYPYSVNAEKFGWAKSGCWTVSIVSRNAPPNDVAGFATLAEARAHGETLPFQWDRFTR